MAEPAASAGQDDAVANLEKIRTLLAAKDDTQRFVGLAILKSVLDNTPHLREDPDTVRDLWTCMSPKFLDRLLRTGSTPSAKDSKDMLDLAVSVLHTFGVLLPVSAVEEQRFSDRIPLLVGALLHSSPETTELILQLLVTLGSTQRGAETLVQIDDLSPLTEIAPSNALALDVLCYSWLRAMEGSLSKAILAKRIEEILRTLIPSFTGTDAVTLLDFLGRFLSQANSEILPPSPPWIKTVTSHIRNLVVSRPSPEARVAYTRAAASLLQVYPQQTAEALFVEDHSSDKPFGYLFINLILIDIRSSAPMLLEQLNHPDYVETSRRLSSSYDIISIFIGFLVRSLDDDGPMIMQPDNLLKLRKGISDTMAVTIEYLRDRWDSSVAGAMGLHPEARTGTSETATGSHHTLAWDSKVNRVDQDPLTLSSLRALSLWLREDENETLREEATGLMDMMMELYQSSSSQDLDFRSPVLVALEALVVTEKGPELLLKQDGWKILSKDLTAVAQDPSRLAQEHEATRGVDTVRVLLPVVEQESAGTMEEWMDLITTVAAWDVPETAPSPLIREFEVAVLQLCSSVLARASQGMRRRYAHSIGAIAGIASRLAATLDGEDDALREQMDDVLAALAGIA